ncbi:MAG: beta-xylosidase [Kibdelosporangium sp.]
MWLLAVAAGLLSACTEAQPQAGAIGGAFGGAGVAQQKPQDRPGPRAVVSDAQRADGNVVAAAGENAVYNYAPSVMVENGRVRMWWCSQLISAVPPGDDVLYAEASALGGPYTTGLAVYGGGGIGFDARHTCDPSVIKVRDSYYLYYTGAPNDHGSGNAIGIGYSPDGVAWTRANNGNPIITSSNEVMRANTYGAGQPSALYLDGWVYLMFTDTNGRAAKDNGAGQFVLRSKDPAFVHDVETLGPKGFTPGYGRTRSVVEAFSADWMWVDALGAFAIAHQTEGGTTITFWNRDFTANPYQPVLIPGPWAEGPGLARSNEGHAPISQVDPCDRIPLDVIRATRNRAEPTDLKHFGLDLKDAGGCADRASTLRTLNGYAVPSPQRTLDVVAGGHVFRVDRRSVAEALGATVIGQRVRALDSIEPAARITVGAEAVRAPGRGIGLLLSGNRLHPVWPPEMLAANASRIVDVSPEKWDTYSTGPAIAVSR